MVAPNPLLPLSVKTATPFTSFQESRTKEAQNQLLESRVRGAERQEMSEQEQAKVIERFRNVESGVKQLSPLLDQAIATGNVDELMAGLQTRRQDLLDQGITDTSDTDTAIQAVQSGNLQGARQLFDQVLSQGQRLNEQQLGITPSEGFTLGAGQTRFGPGGQAVATGATIQQAGFTLSPGQTRFGAGGEEIATGGVDPDISLRAEERLTKQREANLKTEEGLRKEVNTLLKDFFKIADANSRVQVSAQDPSPAGDLALVFNFMKMLDPGSTVREGEFANAAQTGSLESALRNKFGKVFSGEILEFTREDFIEKSAQLFQAAQNDAQKTANAFERIAIGAEVDVGRVLAAFQERRQDIDNGGGFTTTPSASAIEFLRANDTPEVRAEFTRKFGALPEGF